MEIGMFADSRLAEFRECGCGDSRIWAFLRGGISYRVSRPISYASQLKLLDRAPASQCVQGSDWHNWESPSLDGLILNLRRGRGLRLVHTLAPSLCMGESDLKGRL